MATSDSVITLIQIRINGNAIKWKPNSDEVYSGHPKGDTKSFAYGGTFTEYDLSSAVGKIKFTTVVTSGLIQAINTWYSNRGANQVELDYVNTGDKSQFTLNFQNQSLTTDPAIASGSKNTIELEFQGDPCLTVS